MRHPYLVVTVLAGSAFASSAFAQVNLLHPPHHVYQGPKATAPAATSANSVGTPATPAPASSAATAAPPPRG